MIFNIGEWVEYKGVIYQIVSKDEWGIPKLRGKESEVGLSIEFSVMNGELKLPTDKSLWSESQTRQFKEEVSQNVKSIVNHLQLLRKIKAHLEDIHPTFIDEMLIDGERFLPPSERILLQDFLNANTKNRDS